MLSRVLPVWFLRKWASWRRQRAVPEQELADAGAALAEIRKCVDIEHLGCQLSREDLLEMLRHDSRLARLVQRREFVAAAGALERDYLLAEHGRWVLATDALRAGKNAVEGDSTLELILATVVILGFLILVYFLWQ